MKAKKPVYKSVGLNDVIGLIYEYMERTGCKDPTLFVSEEGRRLLRKDTQNKDVNEVGGFRVIYCPGMIHEDFLVGGEFPKRSLEDRPFIPLSEDF